MKGEFLPKNPDFHQMVSDSFARQQFMHFIGAELVKVASGYCEIHLPFRSKLSQQHGFFHAGIIGTLADNAAGYAAYSLMPAGASILSVEFKINLLSPGDGDLLRAKAQVLKAGKTLTVCRSEVYVEKGGVEKLCAAAQVTLIGKVPDSPT